MRLRQLVLRFPEANVGILTGLSRIFVVDIDQAHLAEDMIRRFGATPLMVETPSGGIHLYYRASGERCGDLRRTEQLPVDLKGIGGFVVVPPSVRPSGQHAASSTGSWKAHGRTLPGCPPSSPAQLASARHSPARAARFFTGRRPNR